MLKKSLLALLTAPLLALPLSAFADPSYTMTLLPDTFRALDIGANGMVVGTTGPDDAWAASTWQSGVLTTYGTLGGPRSQFSGISANGLIVGVSDVADGGGAHAFIYWDGGMHDIGTLGADTVGYAINSSGQVAGFVQAGFRTVEAFTYSDGHMTQIGADDFRFAGAFAINEAGTVVGWGEDWATDTTHAFIYSHGVVTQLGTLDGTGYSEAYGINNAGDVVGVSVGDDFVQRAFMYSGGAMRDLGMGFASDINDLSQVVGDSPVLGDSHAFLYTDGHAVDLNTLVSGLGGWTLRDAYAINNSGQIVGLACDDTSCRNFLLDPISCVPEPSTLALLLVGLAGGMGRRLIRRPRGAAAAGA